MQHGHTPPPRRGTPSAARAPAQLRPLLAALLAACAAEPTEVHPICRLEPAFEHEVQAALAPLGPGVEAGLWLARAEGELLYARGADVALACASAIKTAYLCELFAAFAADLDAPLPGAAAILADAAHPAVAHFTAAQQWTAQEQLATASVRRIGAAMTNGSGVDNATYNIAANLVTAHFGGPAALTERLHARDPSWRGLRVRRYMLADRAAAGDNEATAASLAAVLAMLARRDVPGMPASAIDAARAVLAAPPAADGTQQFRKTGSLNSDPVTRVTSGFRTGPGGTVVWVVALVQQRVPTDERPAAGIRLAEAARRIEQTMLAAVP